MEKFVTHTGVGVPLRVSNVDTDQIIPARYLKSVKRTGFADGLFSNWRSDENFILNQEPFKEGSVLFAGPDFGTGSSREHAVWALAEYGFKAVFSSRFADIFRGNSGKAGLLTGLMEQEDIELIWKQLESGETETTVDLEARTVTVGGNSYTFEIDDYTRWRLMEGLDDIGLTLRNEGDIEAFESTRPGFKPRVVAS
ncbi:3-isopropylmalate dehydratase small subunit [Corynebacterium aurimucosum]|uniref:3-isopropylmalate dehydratase small subunit n=1 Tax=Corynebacterium aurimucosum (strain ATCC 700975 / DSM 44827 / CIP 107346 / CN-1) TaxID=548476 RepID=LEUD_CORA7|nr:3-isopropylmalate dehydratase small subunit [Corynebacterium aurimucosum]C3PFZ5.1 RecName: Full=3-isopropylmalate dehydratase small subunit; AltName: Full=Alpha-IPM isomerase; Short=IPMI; AltName: Full=Isopropylmalate isomerase [Corynebacterium aurimucosum ATCC 700975]ACP32749.1 3-isopropylmalate dehydratase small subunit [Corynebacterium aurimucosum ATCC 700975]QQU93083.1 3-isopropylmalate dehydratase small subunit [Corynebacterium aurimucosum]